MRYIVLGAVAAVALAVTAGTASAQRGGHHGQVSPGYASGYTGHGFTGHYPPGHHQPGGHVVHPGGYYAGPSHGVGIGVVPSPAYYPFYPVGPGIGYGFGYGHYSNHARHH